MNRHSIHILIRISIGGYVKMFGVADVKGVVINYCTYNDRKFSFAKIAIGIIGLCLVDQAIKLYIVNNQEIYIAIISDWLAIKIMHNTYRSGVFACRGVVMPIQFYLFYLVVIVAFYILFRLSSFHQKNNRSLLSLAAILTCAGGICAFIDTIVYGGSYDYVLLSPLFIFDLKDCFIEIGLFTMFMALMRNKSWSEIWKDIRDDPWDTKYFRYEIDTWRSLIGKLSGRRKVTLAHPETLPAPEHAASKDEHI